MTDKMVNKKKAEPKSKTVNSVPLESERIVLESDSKIKKPRTSKKIKEEKEKEEKEEKEENEKEEKEENEKEENEKEENEKEENEEKENENEKENEKEEKEKEENEKEKKVKKTKETKVKETKVKETKETKVKEIKVKETKETKETKIKETKETKETKVKETKVKETKVKQKKVKENETKENENETKENEIETKEDDTPTNPTGIRRGRKPKGGKIITMKIEDLPSPPEIPNVILHLKCSLKDLNEYNEQINEMITDPLTYNPSVPPEIMTYNDKDRPFSQYDNVASTQQNQFAYMPIFETSKNFLDADTEKENTKKEKEEEDTNIKDIYTKLKQLRVQLYKNNLTDKKSACFWCTCEYDNPACYIPKYSTDDSIHGYGSFCRPECAVGYLMNENIDDSTKFERYHLLNQIYGKVYGFKRNIKPAPNPYYLLEKFYGNLSIQEYRKLLKTEHMLLVIEKPMTRILPELHEDNDEFILNVYGGTKMAPTSTANVNTGVYKVKRQSEKQQGPSKSTLLKNKFGIA